GGGPGAPAHFPDDEAERQSSPQRCRQRFQARAAKRALQSVTRRAGGRGAERDGGGVRQAARQGLTFVHRRCLAPPREERGMRKLGIIGLAATMAALAGCSMMGDKGPAASATLAPTQGNAAAGSVT